MNIFDCTTFFNERLMMDLRFNILNDHVSKFVVVESTFSHSGEKKKLNFNIDDYPKFKDKIIYIPIDKEPYGLVKGEEQLAQEKQQAQEQATQQQVMGQLGQLAKSPMAEEMTKQIAQPADDGQQANPQAQPSPQG